MVLTYGDENKDLIPVVRFHSEFMFNRFPLKDDTYKRKYSIALLKSVKNGSGIIVIANHNGHDASIGKFLLEQN